MIEIIERVVAVLAGLTAIALFFQAWSRQRRTAPVEPRDAVGRLAEAVDELQKGRDRQRFINAGLAGALWAIIVLEMLA